MAKDYDLVDFRSLKTPADIANNLTIVSVVENDDYIVVKAKEFGDFNSAKIDKKTRKMEFPNDIMLLGITMSAKEITAKEFKKWANSK